MATLRLPCLSIRQPWAWAIVNGFKDVENRDWPTKFRGPILVHAGVKEERDDLDFIMTTIARVHGRDIVGLHIAYARDKALGAIVGGCRITDCVAEMESPWFFGRYGFTVTSGKPCVAVPMKGRLGFWTVEIDWQDAPKYTPLAERMPPADHRTGSER